MISIEDYQRDRAMWQRRWYAEGHFGQERIFQVLENAVKRNAATKLHYYYTQKQAQHPHAVTVTVGELLESSKSIARSLYSLGVRQREVVAIQMPTWLETVKLYLAVLQLGAILLPVVHTYESRELEFILRQSQANTLIIPGRWKKIDFVDRFRRLAGLPHLKRTIVVDENVPPDCVGWNQLLANSHPNYPQPDVGPDEPCLLIYTSGTTSSPKGVLYSHNNLRAEWNGPFPMANSKGPYLSVFPAGHVAGFNFCLRPFVTGTEMVYLDSWDANLAALLTEKHLVAESCGTGLFLRELLRAGLEGERDFSSLNFYTMGGTGVTPAEIRFADSNGIIAGRVYGSTEHSTVTSTSADCSMGKRESTDGCVISSNRVRIVDQSGDDVGEGVAGEILTQGPELFLGYTDSELNRENFAAGGWFKTGDIGRLDGDGFLTILDRIKDIIIRGGEKLSAKEIENTLQEISQVREAAAIAMPDDRYGEKVCAFVQLNAGAKLSLAEIQAHFKAVGVARQKIPEKLVIIDDFPRTPAGKIKKFELKIMLQREPSI